MTVQTVCALPVCLCLLLAGCGRQQTAELTATTRPAIKIDRVEPASTAEKTPFNVQPDGQAALAIFGSDIPAGSQAFWNDQPLQTRGGGNWVAASVPAKLYENAGTAEITLHGPPGHDAPGGPASVALDFTIYAKTGPAPQLTELYPGSSAPGKGFNVQPGGESALGVAGAAFLPGVQLFFDGKPMTTVFGKGTGLSAIIPATSLARAGAHQVWAVNPDGKTSNKMEFRVGK
ncbi:MAG: hypothetical protein ABUS51_01360 [Acidobacteriota bacterium]